MKLGTPILLTLLACSIPAWFGCTMAGSHSSVQFPPKMVYATGVAPSKVNQPSAETTSHPTGSAPKAPGGETYTLTSGELLSELMGIHNVQAGAIDLNDNVYVVPSQEWLVEKFLPHFAEYRSELNLRHRGEGLDCDNFSGFFRQQLVLSNISGGREIAGDVPCGILEVQQKEAFGTVSALGEGFHSLILIRTEAGWMVVEPQDNSIVPLFKYPNRGRIAFIYF
jgi:hypothetical protein